MTILFRIVVSVIIVALLYVVFVLTKSFLSVKTIECHITSDEACSQDLIQALEGIRGKSMFFTNYEKMLDQSQLSKQPVTLTTIQKKFPDTVMLTFKYEPAEYVVIQPSGTNVISETGKAFAGDYDTTGLLPIQSDQDLISDTGYIDTEVHHTILAILTTVEELKLPLTHVYWVDKSTIRLSMENREEGFIVDSESPRLQLYTLSLVLKSNEYRDVSEKKSELDLRFNMPVLRTQP